MEAPSADERQFIEHVGVFFERIGLPPMAGRILGWLLICDPPQQSAGDLAGVLHASKGSISAMVRLLLRYGLIERAAVPGVRRNFFRLKDDAWYELIRAELGTMAGFRKLAEDGLDLLANAPEAQRNRLHEMYEAYAFFERAFPELLKRWAKERQERQKR